MENINIDNYYNGTIGTFKGCKTPKRKPDYISYVKWRGEVTKYVSSRYWYGEDKRGKYVIRESDHWCTYKDLGHERKWQYCKAIASCYWRLKTNDRKARLPHEFAKDTITNFSSGKCYIKNFIPVSSETDWRNAFRKGPNHVLNNSKPT